VLIGFADKLGPLPAAVMARANREFLTRALNLQGKFAAADILDKLSDVDAILMHARG